MSKLSQIAVTYSLPLAGDWMAVSRPKGDGTYETGKVAATAQTDALGVKPPTTISKRLTGLTRIVQSGDGRAMERFKGGIRYFGGSISFDQAPVFAGGFILGSGQRKGVPSRFSQRLTGFRAVQLSEGLGLLGGIRSKGGFKIGGVGKAPISSRFSQRLTGYRYAVLSETLQLLTGNKATAGATSLGLSPSSAAGADGSFVISDPDGAGRLQVRAYDASTGVTTALTSAGDNYGVAITGRKAIYTSSRYNGARMWQDIAGGAEWPVVASRTITLWGDSFGESTGTDTGSGIGTVLINAFTDRTVLTQSIGGQREAPILQRAGALATTGTIASSAIPASGAVAITINQLVAGQGLLASSGNRSIGATIYGTDGTAVSGILAYAASDSSYTFTRTAAGVAVPVPTPCVIVPTTGLSSTATLHDMQGGVNVFAPGRNEIGKADYSLDAIKEWDAQLIDICRPLNQPWLFTSPGTPGYADMPQSQGGLVDTDANSLIRLQQWAEINAYRGAEFGWRYVNYLAAAKAAGLTDAVTVSGQNFDVTNAAFWTGDSGKLHPWTATAKAALVGVIKNIIIAKGW